MYMSHMGAVFSLLCASQQIKFEECFVRLVRPLLAGSCRYILTFPSPADILLAGANSGKPEERGFKIE